MPSARPCQSLLYSYPITDELRLGTVLFEGPDQETPAAIGLIKQLAERSPTEIESVVLRLISRNRRLLAARLFAEQQLYRAAPLAMPSGLTVQAFTERWPYQTSLVRSSPSGNGDLVNLVKKHLQAFPDLDRDDQCRVWKMAYYTILGRAPGQLPDPEQLANALAVQVRRKTAARELRILTNASEIIDPGPHSELRQWWSDGHSWAAQEMARDYGRALPEHHAALQQITDILSQGRFDFFRQLVSDVALDEALGRSLIARASQIADTTARRS